MSVFVRSHAVSALVLVASLAFAAPVSAHDSHVNGECNMIPKNSVRIPIRDGIQNGGLSQTEFNQVLDAVERTYTKDIQARGAKLVIMRDWANAEFNASASRVRNNYVVHMYGGLARFPTMTKEGLLLVACHEMGHHLGESPTYTGDVLASEGQADYFATLKCARRVLAQFNTAPATKALAQQSDPIAIQRCARFSKVNFDKTNDAAAICLRSHMGAITLTNALAQVENADRKAQHAPLIPLPKLSTPDRHVEKNTLVDEYPVVQCRLDTYSAGAQCAVSVTTPLSASTPNSGVCLYPQAQLRLATANHAGSIPDAAGARPPCWYNQLEMEKYQPTAGLRQSRLAHR